jgi:RNA polymerase sigma-B factor
MTVTAVAVATVSDAMAPTRPQPPLGTWTAPAHRVHGADAWLSHGDVLLAELAEVASSDSRRSALRAQVIEWHLPLAVYLASRYRGRGEPLEDLSQVAFIGLIKAVDRFDVQREVPFASYATPTILGELKRHFRDATWGVRVPRLLQELRLHLTMATEDLTHALRRPPTAHELARRLGVSDANVVAAQEAGSAYRPLSFQQPSPRGELLLIDSLGRADPGIEAVDARETLRQRLADLPARDRRIIGLRFFAELTQAQIAADIGISQMQVSRLLASALTRLGS